jgi:uncharacterized membrane protein (DUF2068 family)
MASTKGLRMIALVEAAKGFLVLAAGLGLLGMMHHGAQRVAEKIVRQFQLNPASHYPRIFLDAAGHLHGGRFWWLAAAAGAYAALRFAEAFGLWYQRRWAEWLTVVTAGLYIPIEIYALSRHVNGVKVILLIVNVLVVIYLGQALREKPPNETS